MEQDKQPSCKRVVKLGKYRILSLNGQSSPIKEKHSFFTLTVYGNDFYNIILLVLPEINETSVM